MTKDEIIKKLYDRLKTVHETLEEYTDHTTGDEALEILGELAETETLLIEVELFLESTK